MFFILSFKVSDIHIFLLEIFDRFYLYFYVIFSSFRRNWQIKTSNYIVVETFDFRGLMLFISHFLQSFSSLVTSSVWDCKKGFVYCGALRKKVHLAPN
jgi:hypothetical protein